MNLALHILTGKKRGEEVPLLEDQDTLLSLNGENEVVFDDENATRKHAIISKGFQHVVIKDLHSEKGTFVNGERIKESRLKEGDRVRIGSVTLMLVALNRFSATFQASQARIEVLNKASVRSTSQSESGGAIVGTLKETSVIELVMFLAHSRKSGVLTLTADQGTGKIYLRDGQVYFAMVGDDSIVHPERLFYRLLGWGEGTFSLGPPDDRKVAEEITTGTESLLMEGGRLIDELSALQSELPDRKARLAVVAPPARFHLRDLSPTELDLLQLVLQHGTMQAVLDHHPHSDLEACTLLAELLRRKFIVVQPSAP